MPPKIRELIASLESAGLRIQGDKDSHRKFRHSSGITITISGNAGEDAKHYQIRDVKQAISKVSNERE
jgi:predicted RNA binding protein YcfA (HicA-like mRNA interferase family)